MLFLLHAWTTPWLSSWSSWAARVGRREAGRRPQGGREERGDAHELLTSSCDDGQARLVHTVVYYIRVAKRSESRRASKLSVLLGGGGEHLGVAFYRPEEGGLAGEHSNSPSMVALQRALACERRLLVTTVALRRWSVQEE